MRHVATSASSSRRRSSPVSPTANVQFDYRGRHRVLFQNITPADVRWICTQLSRLTDAQWHDAFRAGGFAMPIADRFIVRMKQKIAEGLALKD